MTEVIDWNVARLEVIEIVLKGWTALDLQIQHNPVDKEIRQWLPQPIADVMKLVMDPVICVIFLKGWPLRRRTGRMVSWSVRHELQPYLRG